MARWDEKTRVSIGNVSLELPTALVKRHDTSLDSPAGVFEGIGITVIIDEGPFADRLDSYIGNPEYHEEGRKVAGIISRTIFFRSPNGVTYTTAIHLPAPKQVTVVVHADTSVPDRVPRQIIDSLQLLN